MGEGRRRWARGGGKRRRVRRGRRREERREEEREGVIRSMNRGVDNKRKWPGHSPCHVLSSSRSGQTFESLVDQLERRKEEEEGRKGRRRGGEEGRKACVCTFVYV